MDQMLGKNSMSLPSGITVDHDPDDLWDDARVIVNIGPTHPAMHGALRMVAKLNGETIEKSYCEFGYTHRAKEKLGENRKIGRASCRERVSDTV